MKTTTEDLCIYFLCFMLGYVFCQNMMGKRPFVGVEGVSTKKGNEDSGFGWGFALGLFL